MRYNILNIKNTENIKGIGISIPFDGNTGLNTTYTTKDSIRSNIINYLMTGKRERILNNNFGSDIRNILFENIDQDSLENLKTSIIYNINNMFDDVNIIELNIIPENNTINIYMKYDIKNSNIEDDILINFQK